MYKFVVKAYVDVTAAEQCLNDEVNNLVKQGFYIEECCLKLGQHDMQMAAVKISPDGSRDSSDVKYVLNPVFVVYIRAKLKE